MSDYPMYTIYTHLGRRGEVYKTNLRADKVMSLARSVWRNNQPLDRVRVVNQETGATRDEISRVA